MNRLGKEVFRLKEARKAPKVLPKNILKSWKIFKGDEVTVISGDDKGLIGKVIKVKRDLNKVIIEGINLQRKHIKTGEKGQGAILDIEAGVHISNVSLIDPLDKKPTRVNFVSVKDSDGNERRTRVSIRTGYEIPLPTPPIKLRLEGPLDTKPEEATRVTFHPDLREPPLPKGCYV